MAAAKVMLRSTADQSIYSRVIVSNLTASEHLLTHTVNRTFSYGITLFNIRILAIGVGVKKTVRVLPVESD